MFFFSFFFFLSGNDEYSSCVINVGLLRLNDGKEMGCLLVNDLFNDLMLVAW